jgi:hypothetical protein
MAQTRRHLVCGPLSEAESTRSALGLMFGVDGKPRPVVYVWIPENTADDPERFARLVRETEFAARLFHPNILQVLGLETVEGKLTRVVAFAEGEPLRKILEAGGRFPQSLAVRILVDACAGVHFAHNKGEESGSLVHGALSMETIFVSYAGMTQVSGYGAQIAFGATKRRNKGAPPSPEQIRALPATRESDVYLLGQVLYECLAGESPFSRESDPDKAALEKAPPTLEAYGVSDRLAAVVARAMAQNPADRFPTAADLREAILAASDRTAERHAVSAYVDILFPANLGDRATWQKMLDAALQGLAKVTPAAPEPEAPATRPSAVAAHRAEPADDLILAENTPLPRSRTSAPDSVPARQELPAPVIVAPLQKPIGPVRAEDHYDLITTAEILLPLGPDGSPIEPGAALEAKVGAAGEEKDHLRPAGPSLVDERPPIRVNPPEPEIEPQRGGIRKVVLGTLVVITGFALGYAVSIFVGPSMVDALSSGRATPSRSETVEPQPAPQPAPTPEPSPEATPVPRATPDSKPEPAPPKADRTRARKTPSAERTAAKPAPSPRPKPAAKHLTAALTVRAPGGAAVFLDGKQIGVGTLKDVKVAEGRHKVMVTLGDAKTEDEFTVGAGETYTYDVTAVGGP